MIDIATVQLQSGETIYKELLIRVKYALWSQPAKRILIAIY